MEILDEQAFENLNIKTAPRLFFIQDYFQNRKYPDEIKSSLLLEVFDPIFNFIQEVPFIDSTATNCLIHVRLTDSHTRSDQVFRSEDLINCMKKINQRHESTIFNVISDDPERAETFLDFENQNFYFRNVEKSQKLNTLDLIRLFTLNEIIICSYSTLCWWGCYLSTRLKRNSPTVFSPYPESLHLESWLRLKE